MSNEGKTDCELCSAKISRGGTTASSYNTSNMIKHLKQKPTNAVANAFLVRKQITTLRQYVVLHDQQL